MNNTYDDQKISDDNLREMTGINVGEEDQMEAGARDEAAREKTPGQLKQAEEKAASPSGTNNAKDANENNTSIDSDPSPDQSADSNTEKQTVPPSKSRRTAALAFMKRNKWKLVGGSGGLVVGVVFGFLLGNLPFNLMPTLNFHKDNSAYARPVRGSMATTMTLANTRHALDATGDAAYLRTLDEFRNRPQNSLAAKINGLRLQPILQRFLADPDINFIYSERRIPGASPRVTGIEIRGETTPIPERTTSIFGRIAHPNTYWEQRGLTRDMLMDEFKKRSNGPTWYRWLMAKRALKHFYQITDITKMRWSKSDIDDINRRAQMNREQARAAEVYRSWKNNERQRRAILATITDSDTRRAYEQTEACMNDPPCRERMVRQGDMISPDARQTLSTRFSPTTIRSLITRVSSLSEISIVACLVAQAGIPDSKEIIDTNRGQMANTNANMGAAGDQQIYTHQNEGDMRVDPKLTGGYNDQSNYDGGAARSNPMKRASGQPYDTSDTISPEASALGFLGSDPFSFMPTNAARQLADYRLGDPLATTLGIDSPKFCDQVTEPWFMGTVLIGELAASLIPGAGQAVKTGGTVTARAISTAIAKQFSSVLRDQLTTRSLLRTGAVVGVPLGAQLASEAAHARALQQMGIPTGGSAQGEEYINQADAGAKVTAQEVNRQHGGRPLTTPEYTESKQEDERFLRTLAANQTPYERYIALHNPDSLLSRMAFTTHFRLDSGIVSAALERMANILNPTRLLTSLPGLGAVTAYAEDAQEVSAPIMQREYGITQWGWSEAEEEAYLYDDEFSPLYNEDQLEASGRLEALKDKYGKCFDPAEGSMGKLLAEEHIFRDNHGNVLAGEGDDCDPDKLGALSPGRIATPANSNSCPEGGGCVAGAYTLGSLTFASEEAAEVFRYRVYLRNQAGIDDMLDLQEALSEQ